MRSLAPRFRPTLLGFACWLLGLAWFAMLSSSMGATSTISPGTEVPAHHYWYVGGPLRLIAWDQWVNELTDEVLRTSLQIAWIPSIILLLATALIAFLFGGKVSAYGGRKATTASAVMILLSPVVAALITSTLFQRMWGFPYQRPPTLLDTSQVRQVERVTVFSNCEFAADPDDFWYAGAWEWKEQRDQYYLLVHRPLVALHESGKLPPNYSPAGEQETEDYLRAVRRSGALVESTPGYDSASTLGGVAIWFEDLEGQSKLLIAARAGQVSNDHYPFYEILFRHGDGRLETLDHQMFYFDIAGVEGMSWWSIFAGLTLLAGSGAVCLSLAAHFWFGGRSALRRAQAPVI
jgi:hypothetical protein